MKATRAVTVRNVPRLRGWLLCLIVVGVALAAAVAGRFINSGRALNAPARALSLERSSGPPPAPAPTATKVATSAVENEPSLVLLGTFASESPSAGSAIIGETEQTAGLRRANTEILPGVWLREVYVNHVVIERGGIRATLLISAASSMTNLGATRLEKPETAALPTAGVDDSVRFGTATGADAIQGVPVFPGRNRGAFARLGLHPGDLITAVNGVPVNASAAASLTSVLQGGTDSTVTVFRAGRLQDITVHSGP